MLQAHGVKTLEGYFKIASVRVLRPHADLAGPADFCIHARDRQATLLTGLRSACKRQFGVDENAKLVPGFTHIHHQELQVRVNLGGGKPYATQIQPKNAKIGVLATRSMPILQLQWRSSALARSACDMHALTRRAMDEHDDDLESEVHVAAEEESESFPATVTS